MKHRGVARLVEVVDTHDMLFIVMQYYRGGDLVNLMQSRNYVPLHEETAKKFTRELADSIKYLHVRGIIHRDIKPENVLLYDVTAVETPVLADFGFA